MHLGFLASYWWAVLIVMALVVVIFIAIAGRNAEGGVADRAKVGWDKWRALSHKAGELQARIILTVFYFTVAVPFGLVRTRFSDPLRLKSENRTTGWLPRSTRDQSIDDAQRQF
jgi:hypothetical protein